MNQLSPVWSQVEKLLADGISITPVEKKVAVGSWKKWQTAIVAKEELWHYVETHDQVTGIAMICGAISGGLEIIDVDVKWKPGIDAVLFAAIKDLYPDLYSRLRIHKTPSGGYHILYRTPSPAIIPGNQKLASRPATQEELAPNPKGKTKCYIETRGEGGYAVAPPSEGYAIFKDNPIPVITWEERCALINLAQNYNEVITPEKPPKASKYEDNYYSENPFEHFNATADPIALLETYGWNYNRRSAGYLWFTKPGGRKRDVHGTFNEKARLFRIWSTNTGLDDKWYQPATLLADLEFQGDKKKLFRHLVNSGFGKIRESVEATMVKKAALRGASLPANASPEAVDALLNTLAKQDELHPYGIFWGYSEDEEGKVIIDRENLYRVANGLGFYVYENEIIQLENFILYKRTDRYFFDTVKAYIKEEDDRLYHDTLNSYESFVQKNGTFTISRLPLLPEDNIIKDTSNSCYKFFSNGYQFITAEEITFHSYDTLTGWIWDEEIKKRHHTPGGGGRYLEFLNLACQLSFNPAYLRRAIGYLTHQYKDETMGYIVILTESCPDPKDGGGSGKNIFSSLLGLTTTIKNVPGSQIQFNEKFFQAWNGERIFSISDLPNKFDFGFLKEISTGSGIIKKLFKDEVSMPPDRMPKILLSTNFSYEISDGGIKRRIIPIEFTDFFTTAGGVDVHFAGIHFPKGWSIDDYSGYDTFIAEAIQEWLIGGRKLKPATLSEGGWQKRFEHTWGVVIKSFIDSHFNTWTSHDKFFLSNEDFKSQWDEHISESGVGRNYIPSTIKLNKAIKEYANYHEWDLLTDQQQRGGDLVNRKGRLFFKDSPF